MFTATLTALKGWPSPVALDCRAQLSANVTLAVVNAGRCVHLNTVGQFELGAPTQTMPIFLLNASNDYDVSNPTGTANAWFAVAPAGWMSGLVATGGYELETTEFDTGQTYLTGIDHLTPVNSNSASNGGTLTNQSLGTLYASSGMTNRVGVVSTKGKYTNAYGQTVLSFWPCYLPGNA